MAFGISAATAAVVGGGLAAAGAIGGALISANGAKKAAQYSSDAAGQANALQQYMYDQSRQDQAPWRQVGGNALNALAVGMGQMPYTYEGDTAPTVEQLQGNPLYNTLMRPFSAQDFETDPGYQFRIEQGQKQLESSAAARGGLLSGAAAKALTKYNQNFASNEYGNAYNRYNTNQTNNFNRLASLAGVGQTATNATQQAGQNYANNAGANLITAGNAAGAGASRASSYIGQGLGFAANQLSNGWGNYSGGNPSSGYSAQTSPVTDYYAGTQPYATLS